MIFTIESINAIRWESPRIEVVKIMFNYLISSYIGIPISSVVCACWQIWYPGSYIIGEGDVWGPPWTLTGFNILLPRGYSINSVAPTKDPPTALEARVEAVNLVNKIRVRSKNRKTEPFSLSILLIWVNVLWLQTRLQDDKLYRSLVDVMCKYGRNPRVNILLKEVLTIKDSCLPTYMS